MRVTKTVREYIEKQVRERLMPKYQAEKDECKSRYSKRDDFLQGVRRRGKGRMDGIL